MASYFFNDTLNIGGTLITSSAAELNLLDGSGSSAVGSYTVGPTDRLILCNSSSETIQITALMLKTYMGGTEVAADDIIEADRRVNINVADDSTGDINIGTNTTSSNNINIGTGNVTRTISIGPSSSGSDSSIVMKAGTGVISMTSFATTTNSVAITGNALTTGSALDITSTSTLKTSGTLVNIAQTGATGGITAPTLTVSTSASSDINAGVALFRGNALTTGKAVAILANALTTGSALDITANALTTGSALNITSSSSAKTTGALLNLAQTGATTLQEAVTLAVSTTATTHLSAGVASFIGNSMTTGKAVAISATALTTGSALNIITNTANATALEIASGFMVMTPQTITIAGGDAIGDDPVANINLFEASVIFIDNNYGSNGNLYRVVKDGAGGTTYKDGQICHIFYDTLSGATLRLDFTANKLCSGTGNARYLTFTSTGQSATIIYVNTKWWIINTGAGIS
jgi:fibronectin-binding autotransporter adhesin